jgi:hypothetical protein
MVWVKLDDHFDDDPRIAAVGPAGAGLLAMLLAYSNRNLTDGFLVANVVRQKAAALPDADQVIALMVQVEILLPTERNGIPGFCIHADYIGLQHPRDKVLSDRQARKERKERWKERHPQRGGERGPERDGNGDGNAHGTLRGTRSGTPSECSSDVERVPEHVPASVPHSVPHSGGTHRPGSRIPDPGKADPDGDLHPGRNRNRPDTNEPHRARGFTPMKSIAEDPDLKRKIQAVANMKPAGNGAA